MVSHTASWVSPFVLLFVCFFNDLLRPLAEQCYDNPTTAGRRNTGKRKTDPISHRGRTGFGTVEGVACVADAGKDSLPICRRQIVRKQFRPAGIARPATGRSDKIVRVPSFRRTKKPDTHSGIWFFDTPGGTRKGGGSASCRKNSPVDCF